MDRIRLLLARVLIFLLCLGMLLPPGLVMAAQTPPAVASADSGLPQQEPAPPTTRLDVQKANLEPVTDVRPVHAKADKKARVVEPAGTTEPGVYLVQLAQPGLATYRGGIAGLQATSPRVTGVQKLDAEVPRSLSYLAYLDRQREQSLAQASARLNRPIVPLYEYKATFNGFAAQMTPAEARQLAQLPTVVRVEREQLHQLHTDAGPEWIGADAIWNGVDGIDQSQGEGVIVGVIDTGIDPWNPSFADVGGDGYDHTNPLGAGNYLGVCDPANTSPPPGVVAYDPTFPCNDKLIGVWGYTVSDSTPRDLDSHGSHTAGTAAGNVVSATLTSGSTATFTATLSGVAPHANIIMYDGCTDDSTCPSSALQAARDQAVLDGVDVINYSIGMDLPTDNFWSNLEAISWLALREAGIFVAAAAGNTGPFDGSVGIPADLPWITSVGAASHDRKFLGSITLDDGANPALTLHGESLSGALTTPSEVVLAADLAGPLGIDADDARFCGSDTGNPFPAGSLTGRIVVCEGSVYSSWEVELNVSDGGGAGYVLAVWEEPGGLSSVFLAENALPAVYIDYHDTYQQLKDYLAAASNPVMGTIAAATLGKSPASGDIMASFSSRGPNGSDADLIAPSVAAPGRLVWAALEQGPGGDGDYTYGLMSGTSMASPHVAGAGALLTAIHSDWTPAEMQSALMLTARTPITHNVAGPTTPFVAGSGRVDLQRAAQAGFVMDITLEEYRAADPAEGGDPKTLNMASLGDDDCLLGSCVWTRTLRSTQAAAVDYVAAGAVMSGTVTVTPASFTLPAGSTQVITIEVSLDSAASDGEWRFGEVTISPATPGAVPVSHMPIAVMYGRGDLPSSVDISTSRNAGSMPVTGFQTGEITDLTVDVYGLSKVHLDHFALFQDPTGGMYDDLDQVYWRTLDVPAESYTLVAQIVETTSPNLDMTVGFDSNGDGLPSAGEEVCWSVPFSWEEFCQVEWPAAGTWWVVVMNRAGSANAPDPITLSTVVVPSAANGNFWVEAPDSIPARQPFDIRVFWNDEMAPGDRFYGVIRLGTDPDHAGNLGIIPVYLTRQADDVRKEASFAGPNAAQAGETFTYTISVAPHALPEDLTYTLTDTIPAGLTYVPGSAAATAGTVAVGDGVLTWTGTQYSPHSSENNYVVTTSLDDPLCDTRTGGYLDLASFGIMPRPDISGDSMTWAAFSGQNPIQFYGIGETGISFTDDGFALFNVAENGGGLPFFNQDLPDPLRPNNLMAIFWNDMKVLYDGDPAHPKGISLASIGSELSIIEYDDVQPFAGDGSVHYDFEVLVYSTVDNTPGYFEIVYAYDNLAGLPASVTVGVENSAADRATQYLFGDPSGAISDGLMICFDYQGHVWEPIEITFAVTVDAGVETYDLITNTVEHSVDLPGGETVQSMHTLVVGGRLDVESGAVLALQPLTSTVQMGDVFGLDVMVWLPENSSQLVDGAAAFLEFDPNVLQVVDVIPGDTLTGGIANSWDNLSGTIDFAAGLLGGALPRNSFRLARVIFQAEGAAALSAVTFNTDLPRQSDVTYAGGSVLDHSEDGQVTVLEAPIEAGIWLQGRPERPDSSWRIPLHVTFTPVGDSTPTYAFDVWTNAAGTFWVNGVAPGDYEVRVKNRHTLANVETITVLGGTQHIDLGTLYEGDANDNNEVEIADFSILVAEFSTDEAVTEAEALSDFNENRYVEIRDFSLLATNFGLMGDLPATAAAAARATLAPSAALGLQATTAGDTFAVAITVDAGGQPVDAAAAYLNFDPAQLQVVDVTPAATFDMVLQNRFDNSAGRVDFAAGSFTQRAEGSFTLATVTFRALGGADANSVSFNSAGLRQPDVTVRGRSVLGRLNGIVSQPPNRVFLPYTTR